MPDNKKTREAVTAAAKKLEEAKKTGAGRKTAREELQKANDEWFKQ
jgi:hypothetical protein